MYNQVEKPFCINKKKLMTIKDLKSQIELAKNILIVLPYLNDADSIASAAMLARLLVRQDKRITIGSSIELSNKYKNILELAAFSHENIIHEIKPVSYIVSLSDVPENIDIAWDKKDSQLDLILTPEVGSIDFDKISYTKDGGIYDLVLVINAPSLADLGEIYTNYQKSFDNYKIISIGADIKSEGLDINSISGETSTSEFLLKRYEDLGGEMDATIYEISASGIVGQTLGLQKNVRARTYGIISELANKHEVNIAAITKKYFGNISKGEIVLKEKVLKNLKFDDQRKVVYSIISNIDATQSGLKISTLDLYELIPTNIDSNYDYAFIAYENGITTEVAICSLNSDIQIDALIRAGNGILGKDYGLFIVNSNGFDAATRTLNLISGKEVEIIEPAEVKVEIEPEVITPEVVVNEEQALFEDAPVFGEPVTHIEEQNIVENVEQVANTIETPAQNIDSAQPIETSTLNQQAITPEPQIQVQPEHIPAPVQSPFMKADSSQIVVDPYAEALKKATYFSPQDRPFN
jgi:nanoRNase/pAp phosphatase (c-di-AMP/oligoRNAs hydrolase)